MIVSFAIGNSDDKLSQADWAKFVADVSDLVVQAGNSGAQVHFAGYSPPGVPWQNALWALDLGPFAEHIRGQLRSELADLCGKYRQDSIAWWEAREAEMIPPAQVTP